MFFALDSLNGAGTFLVDADLWHWMLDQGVGLVLDTGPGVSRAWIVRQGEKNPRAPSGYLVGPDDALLMARLARHLVWLETARQESFDRLPPEERRSLGTDSRQARLGLPIGNTRLVELERCAGWIGRSSGFRIVEPPVRQG